jgi:hypothetical protein
VGIAGGVIVMLSLFVVAGAAMTANDAGRKALRDEVGSRPSRR